MHVKVQRNDGSETVEKLHTDEDWKEPYASPYCAMTNGGAEMEPSKI